MIMEDLLQANRKTFPCFFQAASNRLQHRFPVSGAKEYRNQACPRYSARRGSLRSFSSRARYFCGAVCFSLEQEGGYQRKTAAGYQVFYKIASVPSSWGAYRPPLDAT